MFAAHSKPQRPDFTRNRPLTFVHYITGAAFTHHSIFYQPTQRIDIHGTNRHTTLTHQTDATLYNIIHSLTLWGIERMPLIYANTTRASFYIKVAHLMHPTLLGHVKQPTSRQQQDLAAPVGNERVQNFVQNKPILPETNQTSVRTPANPWQILRCLTSTRDTGAHGGEL